LVFPTSFLLAALVIPAITEGRPLWPGGGVALGDPSQNRQTSTAN
jgi:hypothetical protein